MYGLTILWKKIINYAETLFETEKTQYYHIPHKVFYVSIMQNKNIVPITNLVITRLILINQTFSGRHF